MKNRLQKDLIILKTLKGRLIVTLIIGILGGCYAHFIYEAYETYIIRENTISYIFKWFVFSFVGTYLLSAWLFNDKTSNN